MPLALLAFSSFPLLFFEEGGGNYSDPFSFSRALLFYEFKNSFPENRERQARYLCGDLGTLVASLNVSVRDDVIERIEQISHILAEVENFSFPKFERFPEILSKR